jgi:hypothetical protein
MLKVLILMNTMSAKFYESMRNRYNQLYVLRDGDYVYDVETGIEWRLLEDVNLDGCARSLCSFAPDGCGIKLGTPMVNTFFDDRDRLCVNFKRGMNPNRKFD